MPTSGVSCSLIVESICFKVLSNTSPIGLTDKLALDLFGCVWTARGREPPSPVLGAGPKFCRILHPVRPALKKGFGQFWVPQSRGLAELAFQTQATNQSFYYLGRCSLIDFCIVILNSRHRLNLGFEIRIGLRTAQIIKKAWAGSIFAI